MIQLMVMWVLIGLVCVIDVFVMVKLFLSLKMLRIGAVEAIESQDLPTVSVCISARNETHAMTQCLERIVASDYPKLEVIVLDDGSRDNTSLLIKSFAHAGVRFIEGSSLPDGWLGKNYAQSILANEASGKLVFFLDVDTLIAKDTITRAVTYYVRSSARMVSIIPLRNDNWTSSTLLATMRYFWALTRFSPARPRAVANAWLIERQKIIDEFHSDATLSASMQLETTVAKRLARESAYRLIVSDKWLGLRYEKKWNSQVETSIRLLYPQCHNNVLQVLGLLILLIVALSPYILVWLDIRFLILIIMQYIVAYYYLSHTWAKYRWIGALILPYTLVQEAILLVVSAYRYNFGTITWKGRPITTQPVTKSDSAT